MEGITREGTIINWNQIRGMKLGDLRTTGWDFRLYDPPLSLDNLKNQIQYKLTQGIKTDCGYYPISRILNNNDKSSYEFRIVNDNFEQLKRLSLSSNQIINFDQILKLYSIEELDLSNNQIEQIGDLSGMKMLHNLNLAHNQIKGAIKIGMGGANWNLHRLNLAGNQITDVTSLRNLKRLTYCNLEGNPLPAEQFKEFHRVDL
jgi:Leucine-rich repeat (LRR) protein